MERTGKSGLSYLKSLPGRRRFSRTEKAVLDEVNTRIAGFRSLDETMNFLFDSLQGVCPCDRMGLAFLTPDGERLQSRWVRTSYQPVLLNLGYAEDLRGSSLRTVIERGTPRIINDLAQYLSEHPGSSSSAILVEEGVRSSVTTPLLVDGRIVGVLFQSARTPGRYGEHHAQFHRSMIERISQAVEKDYIIEQLTAANRAYNEVMGFVSHELKGPLASMLMNMEVLRRGYVGKLSDEQAERVEALVRQGNYLLGVVKEYLDLSRIEGGEFKIKPRPSVDFVKEVVEPSIELVQTDIAANGIKLTKEFPGDVRCDCDPDSMKIVMVNLLGNAVKYGRAGGLLKLKLAVKDGRLLVSVWNEGVGFRKSDKENLFRKFSRLDIPEFVAVKGTGLGLYTSWLIIKQHEGRIAAESEYGKWAEFKFEIPQIAPKQAANRLSS